MALVFVYGTLTDSETAASVLPAFEYRGRATLRGLHRVDGHYPTVGPGGETAGRLLETDNLDDLDRYEGVADGLYVRLAVPMATGDGTVEVYVGDPDRLGVDVDWPGEAAFPECVRSYVASGEVRVARDDGPAGAGAPR